MLNCTCTDLDAFNEKKASLEIFLRMNRLIEIGLLLSSVASPRPVAQTFRRLAPSSPLLTLSPNVRDAQLARRLTGG